MEFTISTSKSEEFVDVTSKVQDFVKKSGVKDGLCVVYTPHTTAAVTINENADPSVVRDILASLNDFVREIGFQHAEGNSAAHVKSSIVGCSITVIVENGMLKLGTWQGIYLCEFDGPRERKIYVKIV